MISTNLWAKLDAAQKKKDNDSKLKEWDEVQHTIEGKLVDAANNGHREWTITVLYKETAEKIQSLFAQLEKFRVEIKHATQKEVYLVTIRF